MTSENLPAPTSDLPIAVDVMGGDYGSSAAVEGAVTAARDLGITSYVVGNREEIVSTLRRLNAESDPRIIVCHAPEVVTMDDSPAVVLRRKPNSSIKVAFELVRDKRASAVVSPGNSGAVMAAGLAVVGALPGIVRPAIATLIPKVGDAKPTVLIDAGANIDCHVYQLVQFALMGNYYASSILGSERPRIALLSNGTEPSKGTDVIRAAAQALSQINFLNFIGYIEGKQIGDDIVDVIVCDGFTGNVMLKAMEGTVELVFDCLKHYVEKSPRGKLGMWLAKPVFKQVFKEKLDPSAYGGAPLLGLNEVGIICHGSADSRAIMNGIRAAHKFSREGLASRIGSALTALEVAMPGGFEDGVWGRMGERFEKASARKSGKLPARPKTSEDKEVNS